MNSVKAINMGVSFLLELAMLVALGIWGFAVGGNAQWVLGLGLPAIAVVFWGMWMAPNSSHRIAFPWRPMIALALFLLASVALWVSGHHTSGIVMGIVSVMNSFFVFLWRQ